MSIRAIIHLSCIGIWTISSSLWLLTRVAGGQAETLLLPGLPDMPLRMVAGPLEALLTVAVATVGTFVLIYAVGYMKRESGLCRFYAVMSLFLAAMQALVLSGDWVLLLAAWELIGLCSYLLIGFWFQRPEAADAAGVVDAGSVAVAVPAVGKALVTARPEACAVIQEDDHGKARDYPSRSERKGTVLRRKDKLEGKGKDSKC